MKRFLRGGVLALLLAQGACALTLDSTALGVPVTLAEPAAAQPEGEAFRVTRHPVYLLWGAVGVSRPNLEDILVSQLGPGARIANLRVHIRSRWSDLLVTVLSAGLIAPRSVTFEGIVVAP